MGKKNPSWEQFANPSTILTTNYQEQEQPSYFFSEQENKCMAITVFDNECTNTEGVGIKAKNTIEAIFSPNTSRITNKLGGRGGTKLRQDDNTEAQTKRSMGTHRRNNTPSPPRQISHRTALLPPHSTPLRFGFNDVEYSSRKSGRIDHGIGISTTPRHGAHRAEP